jgi:hypothetical protein
MLRWYAAALALFVGLVAADARASVSIAVSWELLLQESTAAAVVTPLESRSVWESDRIYTYTRVRVERVVAGELPAGATRDGAWIRTMGGVVGKIGQLVEGEAVLQSGQSSLLFVHLLPGPAGVFDVTARGQGQFPLVGPAGDEKTPPHLVRSNTTGALVAPRTLGPVPVGPLAADVVHGRAVDDVARDVVTGWGRTHAR